MLIFTGILEDGDNYNNFLLDIDDIIEPTTIYFTSDGGIISRAKILISELNKKKDLITLIAVDYICSAATLVFDQFEGEKKVMNGTYALYHYFRIDGGMIVSESLTYNHTKILSSTLDDLAEEFNRANKILNAKEKKLINSGLDVYVNAERLAKYYKCERI